MRVRVRERVRERVRVRARARVCVCVDIHVICNNALTLFVKEIMFRLPVFSSR